MNNAHPTKIVLHWWRDQGRGQEAADDLKAEQYKDGIWNAARLMFNNYKDSDAMWGKLFNTYSVNAMTYAPLNGGCGPRVMVI